MKHRTIHKSANKVPKIPKATQREMAEFVREEKRRFARPECVAGRGFTLYRGAGFWLVEERLPTAATFTLPAVEASFMDYLRRCRLKPDCIVVITYRWLDRLYRALKGRGLPVQHCRVTVLHSRSVTVAVISQCTCVVLSVTSWRTAVTRNRLLTIRSSSP
jgi:hypothetical protein